ncbi:MAG: gliding motility-associated C-terminal domain-containing protein [Tenericutes bacterium]|nr:gliding motility-associated C-terminal domain-containing protein [Mycoplasmatota bacterium]
MSFVYKAIVVYLLIFNQVFAQNLIYNSSFEQVDTPMTQSFITINAALGWEILVGSPDLLTPLHYNGFFDYYGAPANIYGYQKQNFGANFSHIFIAINWYHLREYFSGTLKSPLEASQQYCMAMYISLPDSYAYYYQIDCLEAYFSNGLPDTTGTNGYLVNFTPQASFLEGTVFTDTSNWQKVSGTFTAAGGENTITIGCFQEDDSIMVNVVNPFWAYGTSFYIDAIALYPCDAPVYEANAGNDTSICIGESLVLGTHDLPQYEYLWLNEAGDTLSTEAFLNVAPEQTVSYTLELTDFKFDRTTDDITVQVEECNFPLYVPNIFSPNNDGNNDLLCVRGQQIETLQFFALYDRWGEEVFSCKGTSMTLEECCWDGKHKGENLPEAVYFWYAEALMKSGKIVSGKGDVVLLR